MSVQAFAAHLGVTDRMVSKWEAGGRAIRPRPVNQAALDTSLARGDVEVQARFAATAHPRRTGLVREGLEALLTPAAVLLLRHPVDGKLMTLVDAGVFRSGPDNKPGWLGSFYIDLYPTTNADYALFVASTDHRPPDQWADHRDGAMGPTHPVVGVSWHDAQAYAAWADKALPTGSEWEKAARGDSGRVYPWGAQSTPGHCNVRESRIRATTPVDWYDNGVSPCGVYDLCGNVWEWCAPAGTDDYHEVRGGAFTTPLHRAVPYLFDELPADARRCDVGFRCVASMASMLELLSI